VRLYLLHRTTFTYDVSARDSFNEARLQPVDGDGQRLISFSLQTDPAASLSHFTDYFGNAAHRFAIAAPHPKLTVEARSEVETEAGLGHSALPAVALRGPDTESDFDLQVEFIQPSRYVPLEAELGKTAAVVIKDRDEVWSAVQAIYEFVYHSMRYRQQTTGIETTALEALKLRAGVCQDFAHIALGLCRSAGIPARYVSGYFLDPQRKPDQIEASHAWAEAWVPGAGWVSFDPTHNCRTDERYIRLAVGRDYADIRPIAGTYQGSPTREMRVEVSVRPAEAEVSSADRG
jgi:transglutaminase-like putative cysteine protease